MNEIDEYMKSNMERIMEGMVEYLRHIQKSQKVPWQESGIDVLNGMLKEGVVTKKLYDAILPAIESPYEEYTVNVKATEKTYTKTHVLNFINGLMSAAGVEYSPFLENWIKENL